MVTNKVTLALERPPTLTNTVAKAIEEAILRGDLLPGSPLVESRLREQLSVSRSTLREAFRLLEDRGLLESIAHRGMFVTALTLRKAKELFSLRSELEAYAVRLGMAQKRYTEAAIEDMRKQCDRLYDLAGKGDHIALVDADMEFHRMLSSYADHEMLISMLDGLLNQTRRFIILYKLYQSNLTTEAQTHEPVWEALRSGDSTQADAAIREHIRQAGEQLFAKMEMLD